MDGSKFVKKQICRGVMLLVLLSGCSQQQVVVVLRSTPPNPSFTVISPNDFLVEVHFANLVEETLIKSGAKVLRRPAGKTGEIKNSAGKKIQTDEINADQKLIATESFRDIDEFTSDFLVETFAEYRQIKFTNCKSHEIVSIVTLEKDSYNRDDLSRQLNRVEDFVKILLAQSKTNQPSKSLKK